MKFAMFERSGVTGPGLIVGDDVVALGAIGYSDVLSIVRDGAAGLSKVRDAFADLDERWPLTSVRLLAPIPRPGKFLGIGMNYQKHIAEAEKLGVPEPKRQFWFNKQTTCIIGPSQGIVKPDVSDQIDYEVELGVVIGEAAKGVAAADARAHIFGFMVVNDVSTRDWQFHSPTFTMGKSFDTHGPTGPWIITADEIADCHALDLKCWVNGELRQSSNTSQMVANVYDQIEYLSTAFTLEPGDILATGTPEGVGIAMDPPRFLKVGDVVRCEVEGIGSIENPVVGQPN